MDELKAAFDAVKAEETLKASTKAFLTERKSAKPVVWRVAMVAACLCLLLCGVWAYYTPAAQISVEINPLINLTVNRFDRVIRAEGGNADGEAVLENLNLQHMQGTRAVENILCQPAVAELIDKGELLSVGVIGDSGPQTEQLLGQMEDCVSTAQRSECYYATPEEQQQAQAAGMSCGKYRKLQHLQELHSDLTAEEVQDMSMGQIHRHIEALKESAETQQEQAQGNGHQYGKHTGEHEGKGNQHGKK